MGARSCYSRYPSDFIGGIVGLGLELIGAYTVILDLIYDRGGPIPDDDFWLAGICGCSSRKFRSVKKALLAAEKLYIEDGKIGNRRAVQQIFERNSRNFREKTDSRNAHEQDVPIAKINDLAEKIAAPSFTFTYTY
jgi:uncharacterized protein YdaU (DUF1376 family)